MSVPNKRSNEIKNQLHPRNKHKYRYDFPELIASCPDLSQYVSLNPFHDLSIDFKNPDAVKALNRALLQHFYGISSWDIPAGYLCPPIPGRADYIHYIADLLASTHKGVIPPGSTVKVLDIGVGANCIYPLIGNHEYGWTFVGSEIDPLAIRSAKNMIDANALSSHITIRKQSSTAHIFTGLIKPGESFTITMCNPPFHASQKEATAGTERKWENLGHKNKTGGTLNFGGTNAELWCEGGEERFVTQMIKESADFAQSCQWFTSLISKKDTLKACYRALDRVKVKDVKVINMAQGQKISRVLAWTFIDQTSQ